MAEREQPSIDPGEQRASAIAALAQEVADIWNRNSNDPQFVEADLVQRKVTAMILTAVQTGEISVGKASSLLSAKIAELQILSNVDWLTRVYSRAGFTPRLEEELKKANRRNAPVSLVLIDLDNFKPVNDTFGHPVGDHVLAIYAGILKSRIRLNDIIGRLGGDEFGIIMPDTTALQASLVMNRVINGTPATGHAPAIPPLAKTVIHDTLRTTGNRIGAVTMSVGITDNTIFSIPSGRFMYETADQALYKAKQRGKNQVTIFKPPA